MDEYTAKLGERLALMEERLASSIRAHNNLVKEFKQLETKVNGNN